jgi:hypothetical protein
MVGISVGRCFVIACCCVVAIWGSLLGRLGAMNDIISTIHAALKYKIYFPFRSHIHPSPNRVSRLGTAVDPLSRSLVTQYIEMIFEKRIQSWK